MFKYLWKFYGRNFLFSLTNLLPCKVIKGPNGKPFLERYHLFKISFLDILIVIHRFVDSDPDRGFHDHPWSWAFSWILSGGYDELIIPKRDSPVNERYRKTLNEFDINWINPNSFHRVLLNPGTDAWTIFVMGPRVKVWGFLAQKERHKYSEESSNSQNHYDRKGVEEKSSKIVSLFTTESDLNFKSEKLEYRPFTTSIQPSDDGWWLNCKNGQQERETFNSFPDVRPSIVAPNQIVVLISGKMGSGKDFVSETLKKHLNITSTECELFRIGSVTKRLYAEKFGLSFKELETNREFKDKHRDGLTKLYDELNSKNQNFEIEEVACFLKANTAKILIVVDLRMRYELAYMRSRVLPSNLIHLCIKVSKETLDKRGVVLNEKMTQHITEKDLDDVKPDLIFNNDYFGEEKLIENLFTILSTDLKTRKINYDIVKLFENPKGNFSNVKDFLKKSLDHEKEYETEILGKKLLVHPQVMSPKYSYSSTFVIQNWNKDDFKNVKVLDIGTGTGILALFAAFEGAKEVIALDINPFAVQIAKENVKKHNMENQIKIVESDGFEALKNDNITFDIILFNPPFFDHETDSKNPLTYSVYDQGHKFLKRVINEAPKYLSDKGKLIIVMGSSGLGGGKFEENFDFLETDKLKISERKEEVKGHKRILFTITKK